MILLSLLSTLANAAETTGQTTTALTINRIALSSITQYGLKIPKWEEEGNAIRQGTGITAVGEVSATPAFIRTGGRVTVTPLAVLKLQAYGFGHYYFGNFQTIVGYDTPTSVYGDNSAIADYVDSEAANDVVRQTSGMGWSAGAKMTLQAKVGNIVFSNTIDAGQHTVIKPEDVVGTATFEREREVMINFDGDQIVENNTLLLYQIDRSEDKYLRLGNLTTYRHSIGADDTMLRSGLLAVYQPKDKRNHVLIVQHYLQDNLGYTSDNATGFTPYVAYANKVLF